MSDLFDIPVIVAVVNSISLKPRSKDRKIDTFLVWPNNESKSIIKAFESYDSRTLKKYYKYDPFEYVTPPKLS